jgi:hypothetical protein
MAAPAWPIPAPPSGGPAAPPVPALPVSGVPAPLPPVPPAPDGGTREPVSMHAATASAARLAKQNGSGQRGFFIIVSSNLSIA